METLKREQRADRNGAHDGNEFTTSKFDFFDLASD
jgi:hypothetical protein